MPDDDEWMLVDDSDLLEDEDALPLTRRRRAPEWQRISDYSPLIEAVLASVRAML